MRQKVVVCLKGPPLNPSNTIWLFPQNVLNFFNILEKCIWSQFKNFSQKYAHNKKREECLTARSSNCCVSAKLCPLLVETPYSGGVINPKICLNHKLHTTLLLALPAERVRQLLRLQVGSSERKVQVAFVISLDVSVIPSI